MLSRIRNFFNPKVDYTSAINFAIDKYIEGAEIEDEEYAYDALHSFVGDEHTTNQIYVFLPVALTRIWLKNQPIKLSDSYSKVDGKGGGQLIRLDSLEIYRQIMTVLEARLAKLPEIDVLKILYNSSEFKIINKALLDGSQLENLRMSPPASGV